VRWHALTLLTQLRLALLDGRHHHVADGRTGNLIEATLDALNGDDVQVLGASVVSAVHDGAHRKTKGRAEFVAHGTAAACNRGVSRLAQVSLTLVRWEPTAEGGQLRRAGSAPRFDIAAAPDCLTTRAVRLRGE
jgi:hypothetical protein